MNKKGNEYLKEIASFDFKNLWVQNPHIKSLKDEDIIILLKKAVNWNEIDSVELFCDYKSTKAGHLDDSDGRFIYMRAIYNILWGRNEKDKDVILNKYGYNNFRTTKIFSDRLLFGGDTINSVQTLLNRSLGTTTKEMNVCKDKDTLIKKIKKASLEEICQTSGCIGNYVLVPAYFNVERGGNDDWDKALNKLKDKGFLGIVDKMIMRSKGTLKKDTNLHSTVHELYGDFLNEDFKLYINAMFLWDYVCKKNNEYIVEEKVTENWLENTSKLIIRRGIFMASMIRIAIEFPKGEYPIKNKDWENWNVSYIYKKILDKVILTNEVLYSSYSDVFEAIREILEDNEYIAIMNILNYANLKLKS